MLYQARLVLKTIAYGRLRRNYQAKIGGDFAERRNRNHLALGPFMNSRGLIP